MSDKANENKIVTKDFLQKYQQKSFQTISEKEFNKLSQAEKDCGITYYIYDKDTTYPENKVVSDKWDAEAIYEIGSYCIYKEQLWKCITRNSGITPVEGDDWKAVSVGDELKRVNEGLDSNNLMHMFYVDATNGSDNNDGSQASPFKTIQKAINSCNKLAFNEIHIADGTYAENINIFGFTKRLILIADGRDCNVVGYIGCTNNQHVMLQYFNTIQGTSSKANGVIIVFASHVDVFSYDSSHHTKIIADRSAYQYMACIFATSSAVVNLGAEEYSNTSYIELSGAYKAISAANSVVSLGMHSVIDDTNYLGIVSDSSNVNAYNTYTNNAMNSIASATLSLHNKWQLIGNATGTNSVTIDANKYNEFLVYVNNTNGLIPILISSNVLNDSSYEVFRGGYAENATYNGNATILANKTDIHTESITRDNANITEKSSIQVFAR